MKNADPFPERHAFFYEVITAVLIDKTAAKFRRVGTETRFVILFGERVDLLCVDIF